MLAPILAYIDRTTMYRLVLYYLCVLYVAGLALSVAGVIKVSALALIWSLIIVLIASWASNELFARLFKAVTNQESLYITAFILVLIMPPVAFTNITATLILALVAVTASASKYLLAPFKKHVFNPVAISAVVATYLLGTSANWWVASSVYLLPLTILGGIAVAHKLRKFDLIWAFLIAVLFTTVVSYPNPAHAIESMLLRTPLFFFAFAMLTEPLTMPPTRMLRAFYGFLVGILFVPATHIGSLSFAPELALVVGNVFAFFVSPKGRYMLTLTKKTRLAEGIYEYVFSPDKPLSFTPGQYLEWTLAHVRPDGRGNRRYFTIASAPGEPIALGVRFYPKPSEFKKTLDALPEGGVVSVASLSGDFVLPKNTTEKVALVAGGIGITPFISMARSAIKTGEKRDVVHLYGCKVRAEIAYGDVLSKAGELGWRTVYALSDEVPTDPAIHRGFINADLIKKEIPDFAERTFYISGPPGMITAVKKALTSLGVSRLKIKTDFFPGLA